MLFPRPTRPLINLLYCTIFLGRVAKSINLYNLNHIFALSSCQEPDPSPKLPPSGGLKLSPCLLAKIFLRQITTWDDPDILAENPDLKVDPGSPITVLRRTDGSSSTSGITAYLSKACPEVWGSNLVGSTIEWPAGTSGHQGSGGITEGMQSTAMAITYLSSGEGSNSAPFLSTRYTLQLAAPPVSLSARPLCCHDSTFAILILLPWPRFCRVLQPFAFSVCSICVQDAPQRACTHTNFPEPALTPCLYPLPHPSFASCPATQSYHSS